MAKRLFVNYSKVPQVVYDDLMNKYEVEPGGPIEADETFLNKYATIFKPVNLSQAVKPGKEGKQSKEE